MPIIFAKNGAKSIVLTPPCSVRSGCPRTWPTCRLLCASGRRRRSCKPIPANPTTHAVKATCSGLEPMQQRFNRRVRSSFREPFVLNLRVVLSQIQGGADGRGAPDRESARAEQPRAGHAQHRDAHRPGRRVQIKNGRHERFRREDGGREPVRVHARVWCSSGASRRRQRFRTAHDAARAAPARCPADVNAS